MRNILLFFVVAFAIAIAAFASSCKKTDTTTTDYAANANCSGIVDTNNTYNKSIKTILNTYCATSGCHNASAQAGVNLSDYVDAKSAFQNKAVLCSVHHGSGCQPMPQGGSQLSSALINQLDCWAKNGYKQ